MSPKLLVAFISLGITLGMAEVVLARFAPQRTVDRILHDQPPMFRLHEVRVRDLVPGFEGRLIEREFETAVRINSLGYRQPAFSPERDGEIRILVVGDSFAIGYGVEEHESFVAIMAAELVRCGVRSAQVVNAGVPGRWLDSYYLELKTRVLALNPDVVLVSLFHGNDLASPDSEAYEWVEVDADGLPVRLRSPETVGEDGRSVSRNPKLRWRLPMLRNPHVVQLLYDSGTLIHRSIWPRVRSVDMYENEYTAHTLDASSQPVLRGFCPKCGTSLTYQHRERPDELDVTLDDAGALRPECHIWVSDKAGWVDLRDELPQYPEWRQGA